MPTFLSISSTTISPAAVGSKLVITATAGSPTWQLVTPVGAPIQMVIGRTPISGGPGCPTKTLGGLHITTAAGLCSVITVGSGCQVATPTWSGVRHGFRGGQEASTSVGRRYRQKQSAWHMSVRSAEQS